MSERTGYKTAPRVQTAHSKYCCTSSVSPSVYMVGRPDGFAKASLHFPGFAQHVLPGDKIHLPRGHYNVMSPRKSR